jgi:hypothetical protein
VLRSGIEFARIPTPTGILANPATILSNPPDRSARPVFQRHANLRQAFADLISEGEVLRLARFRSQVDEQLHEAAYQRIVAGFLDWLRKKAE